MEEIKRNKHKLITASETMIENAGISAIKFTHRSIFNSFGAVSGFINKSIEVILPRSVKLI